MALPLTNRREQVLDAAVHVFFEAPDVNPSMYYTDRLPWMGAGHMVDPALAVLGEHIPQEWGMPDVWLTDQQLRLPGGRDLDVVPTPGHTAGHVVFHDTAARLLFAGDHVLPRITPSIGFDPVLSPNPLGDFLESLATVRRRPDAMLLPAHGQVTDSVHRRVDELLAHHDGRLTETEACVRQGATTAFEAAGLMGWTPRRRRLDELDPFNGMMAVFETSAHLELLVAQVWVVAALVDGVARYVLR